MFWIFSGAVCLSACAIGSAGEIRGAWHAHEYILQQGHQHDVERLIFFTESDWTVLFFVTGEDGEPRRGSAEGGTYTLEGDRLVFTHGYNLSFGESVAGLAAAPLTMRIAGDTEAAQEPCTAELEGDSLILRFPSGNSMTFVRSSRF